MNRKGLWAGGVALILLVVVGAAALLTSVGAGYAKDENASSRAKCSKATLKGTYLFAFNGAGLWGSPSPGPSGILDPGSGASGGRQTLTPRIETGTTTVTVPLMVVPMSPGMTSGTPGEDDRWLRSVVENSSEIVTIVDPDGTLRYASPAFERMLGYDS